MKNTRLGAIMFLLWFIIGDVQAFVAAPGFHYQKLETHKQEIYLLEVDPALYIIIAVKADNSTQKAPVSTLVQKYHAVAGVNGGFFEADGAPAGALKINGQWLALPPIPRGAIGWSDDAKTVLMDRIVSQKNSASPTAVLPQIDTTPSNREAWQSLNTIMGGIPLLIKEGKLVNDNAVEAMRDSFIHGKHARTAVCIKENNHWLFLVVPHVKFPHRSYGQKIFNGLTIKELAMVLKQQGCQNALNLDGGGSSTLVVNNKVKNPNAGDFDETTRKYTERPVSDAILILKR